MVRRRYLPRYELQSKLQQWLKRQKLSIGFSMLNRIGAGPLTSIRCVKSDLSIEEAVRDTLVRESALKPESGLARPLNPITPRFALV